MILYRNSGKVCVLEVQKWIASSTSSQLGKVISWSLRNLQKHCSIVFIESIENQAILATKVRVHTGYFVKISLNFGLLSFTWELESGKSLMVLLEIVRRYTWYLNKMCKNSAAFNFTWRLESDQIRVNLSK